MQYHILAYTQMMISLLEGQHPYAKMQLYMDEAMWQLKSRPCEMCRRPRLVQLQVISLWQALRQQVCKANLHITQDKPLCLLKTNELFQ